ncbi:Importin subunit alpha-1 [Trichoplax sp. H2]|nr:Importin subunit alpha-1 [Trichoplax sp. H2]|eukprot:RDD44755.1 Importin subunit alpha-1 [Trichoplax sp. H2]
MASLDHSHLYKHASGQIEDRRNDRRKQQQDFIRRQRDQLISSKRPRYFNDNVQDEQYYDSNHVQTLARGLLKHNNSRMDILKNLCRAFTQDEALISTFLGFNREFYFLSVCSVDNALQSLIGILTQSDSDLQEHAAWCITNICTGNHKQTLQVTRLAAPYCITYLSGQNLAMQDQCAWAIGNMAGDGKKSRKLLVKQGVTKPLVSLLNATSENVIQSAAFALSNFTREDDINLKEMIDCNVLKYLTNHLQFDKEDKISFTILPDILHLLHHITAKNGYDSVLLSTNIVKLVTKVIRFLTESRNYQIKILTPAIRIIGNLAGGLDEFNALILEEPRILDDLIYWINHNTHRCINYFILTVASAKKLGISSEYEFIGGSQVNLTVINESGIELIKEAIKRLSWANEIGIEAAMALRNYASLGSDCIQHLARLNALQAVTANLKSADVDKALVFLDIIQITIATIPDGKRILNQLNIQEELDLLLYRDDESLRKTASQLLDSFFAIENS